MLERWWKRAMLFAACVAWVTPLQGQTPSGDVLRLSLDEAIRLALQNHLQVLLAREAIQEARGRRSLAQSALMPHLTSAAYQADLTANLAAMGLGPKKIPGLDPFVGPFSRFDARLQLVQSIFNLAAVRRYQAAARALSLARVQEQSAEQQIIVATALAYIAALEAEQEVQAARADLELARRLFELAQHSRQVGVATGVDVARAETHLAAQEVRLAQARTDLETAQLNLLRLIGAPLSSQLQLTDALRLASEPLPSLEEALGRAWSERLELKAAEEQLKIAQLERQAALASWLPSISFFGDYGSSAIRPLETSLPTRSIGLRLDFPVFDGGRTRSEIQISASRLRQAELRLKDLRAAIEKEVREAHANLQTRREQVEAARKAVELAERELEMAQDRFRNGVASNIEVINAQAALENARKGWIQSLALYNVARLNLAAAMGRPEDFRL